MKNIKKLICIMLALVMVLSLAACANNGGNDVDNKDNEVVDNKDTDNKDNENKDKTDDKTDDNNEVDDNETGDDIFVVDMEALAAMEYDEMSSYVYDLALGEFYDYYVEAKEQTDVNVRWALMAIAEAKLLESGIMMPLTTNGGNYAISRVAPYGIGGALWGNDQDRFHDVVVATEFITAADRAEMKAKYAEIKGTGTWEQWAKDFLTGKGYELKDTYTLTFNSDPQTWDPLNTSRAADSEALVNTYDGLIEYDSEGVMQPALAESWEVSADGTVYTFHLREGVIWTDAQGRKVADVKADDFVAGAQHMMDAMGGLEYLIEGVVVGASEYIYGETTDFADVGFKALDDLTLEITLCQPTSYFMTMLAYNCFAPMSRDFFLSKGGAFGQEAFQNAKDGGNYTYGTTPNDIAYCGPYLVTNFTSENTIVFQLSDSYWNKDNVNMKTITWLFNDGQDATKAYNDAVAGTIDGAGLNASALEAAKADGLYDEYAYVSATDATSFMAFYNLYRLKFCDFTDETKAVSTITEDEIERSRTAMLNQNFRVAIALSLDRASYNATTVGEDLKLNSLRNTYTPGNFVSLTEDVTVDINGTATTYAAGTYYGKIMQDQIDADGYPIQVWDDANSTSDSFDGWYFPDKAAEYLNKAIEELAAAGVEVSADKPIYLDLPAYTGSEVYTNRANVYKQSLEENMKGCVVINLIECATALDWYNCGYYPEYGYDMNANIMDVSGWGPDYGDPQTYLDTMLPDYAGYMVKSMGIF